MPFQEGGSVESDIVGGRIGSTLPAARLIVDPDQVAALKEHIEQECLLVQEWLVANDTRLSAVPAPGTDPCSDASAKVLAENGKAAIKAAKGYVTQLARVAEALGEIARAYRLTEQENTGKLGGGTK